MDIEIIVVIVGMVFVFGFVVREFIDDVLILFGKDEGESVK